MTARRLTVVVALGSSLLLPACGGPSSTSSSSPACPQPAATPATRTAAPPSTDLVAGGTLTFASDLAYPPQEFSPPGCSGKNPDGFDIDVARAIAARMRLKATIVDTKFEGLIPALTARRVDVVVSAMPITDERKQAVQFVPYLLAGESFVTLGDSRKRPQTIADLCGLRVAVEKGTAEEVHATDANNPAGNGSCAKNPVVLKDHVFAKDTEALAALRQGKVDVHFTDSAVAAYELLKSPGLAITNKAIVGATPEGLAVRKDDGAMYAAVNAAFDAMKADGTYQRLLDEWLLSAGAITRKGP